MTSESRELASTTVALPRRGPKRWIRLGARAVFHYVLTPLVPRLPLPWIYATAVVLGRLNHAISTDNRKAIERNLRVAFPEKSDAEIRRISRANFENAAKLSLEIFLLPKLDELMRDRLTFEGLEHIQAALRRGKGTVFSITHLGIYYLAGVATDRLGGIVMNDITQDVTKLDLSGVERKILTRRLESYQKAIRGKMVNKGFFLRDIVRGLQNNEGVSLFLDAKGSLKETPVEFLGMRTYLQPGAVTLALKTDCTILIGITLRTPDNRWRIVVPEPIELERTGDRERDIEVNVQKLARILEGWIRKHPDQWHLWREFHLRWADPNPTAGRTR